MDPEIRALQIPIIKSILLLQQKVDQIKSQDTENEELLKPFAREIYDLLIPYLINLTELRSKGLAIKEQLENILGIGETNSKSVKNEKSS
jgi:hypothetical protein